MTSGALYFHSPGATSVTARLLLSGGLFIKGRVKPRALALGIKAASLRLTGTYVLGYTPYIDTPPEPRLPRWTITRSPPMMDEVPPLAAVPRRSSSSELVWALDRSVYDRAAEKETGC